VAVVYALVPPTLAAPTDNPTVEPSDVTVNVSAADAEACGVAAEMAAADVARACHRSACWREGRGNAFFLHMRKAAGTTVKVFLQVGVKLRSSYEKGDDDDGPVIHPLEIS
jgi:hypothetical protein